MSDTMNSPQAGLPEPTAHIYPSDLARFAKRETFGHAYSVAVGNPDEQSEPLFTAAQMLAFRAEGIAAAQRARAVDGSSTG